MLPVPYCLSVSSLLMSGMPLLEELRIIKGLGQNQTPLDLTKSPLLTKLYLDVTPVFTQPMLPSSDAHQAYFPNLRNVDMKGSRSTVFSILSNAPSLIQAFIIFRDPSDAFLPESLTLHLPSLRRLAVGTSNLVNPAIFFDRLHASALRTLNLDFGFDIGEEPWIHLNNMLRQSRPPLESLKVADLPNSHGELLLTLELLPTLKSLMLHQTKVNDVVLVALTDRTCKDEIVNREEGTAATLDDTLFLQSCPSGLCPKLENIVIYNCGIHKVSLVGNMIVSRAGAAPLKSLELVGIGFDRNALIELQGVRRCVDEGLVVEVAATWGL